MEEVQKDKKQYKKTKLYKNLTEKESSKNSNAVTLWSTDEKGKLLLCVAKIVFQFTSPYTVLTS